MLKPFLFTKRKIKKSSTWYFFLPRYCLLSLLPFRSKLLYRVVCTFHLHLFTYHPRSTHPNMVFPSASLLKHVFAWLLHFYPKNVLGLLPDLAGAWQETLLSLLILSLLGFHDITFSWFSPTSSQPPLSVHPSLIIITYQNSWRLVLGDLLTLLFRMESKRTEGRQQGDQNRRVREVDLYTKRWVGKAEISKSKEHDKQV